MADTAFALFDFDDSLSLGDSVLPYLLYCVRRGDAPWTQLPKALSGYLLWRLRPSAVARAKESALSFIKGRSLQEMDELARGFFREEQSKRFFQDGLKELWRLRAMGYHILVVSASADCYMRVLPEFLPVDGVLATECAVDGEGRYTGRVGPNCKGEEKTRRIAAFLEDHGLRMDRVASRAYGDSASDAPMLLLTDAPVLVNPRKRLKARLPDASCVRWR